MRRGSLNPPKSSAMNKLPAFLAAAAAFLSCPVILTAQDFGNNTAELREVAAAELAKPDIPDIQVGDNPNPVPLPVPRPVYLVYRYYSCSPWYPWHVRDVYTSVVARGAYGVEIDTGGAINEGDDVERQIVTDINHPAYGLYCITIRVCVPWQAWQHGLARRWYIRWAWGAPYWCWQDHWWYYWQRPCVNVALDGGQEVPPVVTNGRGTATVCVDQSGVVHYTVSFSGLNGLLTNAHFHGPAGPGVPAGALAPLDFTPAANQQSGTFSGSITSPTAALLSALASGQVYINLHSTTSPGGEIRGQVPAIQPGPAIWCPYGPAWWPCLRWTRWGTAWGLTVCHPYCYRWNPFYVPRNFCLYGLRYYFTPIGNVRVPLLPPQNNPGQLVPGVIPANNNMNLAALGGQPWRIYDTVSLAGIIQRPPFYYWPFTPYCQRWYWFRCLPFSLYRFNPPVVHFGIWLNPAPGEVNADFPDMPVNDLPGTHCTLTTRPLSVLPADLNGDGQVNAGDQANYRQQAGTQTVDSFFDIFTELEFNDADAAAAGKAGARKK